MKSEWKSECVFLWVIVWKGESLGFYDKLKHPFAELQTFENEKRNISTWTVPLATLTALVTNDWPFTEYAEWELRNSVLLLGPTEGSPYPEGWVVPDAHAPAEWHIPRLRAGNGSKLDHVTPACNGSYWEFSSTNREFICKINIQRKFLKVVGFYLYLFNSYFMIIFMIIH